MNINLTLVSADGFLFQFFAKPFPFYATFLTISGSTKLPKFDSMQVQVDIKFDQLVQIAKRLPATQWTKLKKEVDSEKVADKKASDREAFLLTAPTFTKKQLNEIDKTRKAINQWRTK